MNDIIERLRSLAKEDANPELIEVLHEAADEIKRLRHQLDAIEQDGTAEHNAAVTLRGEMAALRAAMREIRNNVIVEAVRCVTADYESLSQDYRLLLIDRAMRLEALKAAPEKITA